MERFDAVVAGGGPSGSVTAAALCAQGLRVLVCEPKLPSSKRLAGELMHPPAVDRLHGLDLSRPLQAAGAVPVYGFAIFASSAHPGRVLSYSEIPGARPAGMAIEHSVLTRTLLSETAKRTNVCLWEGARVLSADLNRSVPVVRVRTAAGDREIQARVVVSAEGRSSALRERAGIACARGPSFRMLGWKIPNARLPYPGYGHVFLGGETATLAYQVSSTDVRIMFEVDGHEGTLPPEDLLQALPPPFRWDVRTAIESTPAQSAKVFAVQPEKFASGHLAVVGDAGGCAHPVSASGISYCTRDAVSLAQHLGDKPLSSESVSAALERYDREKRRPMRARMLLGPALVHAFSGKTPDSLFLRSGLFDYWDTSWRGRRRSLQLLSTYDQSTWSLAKEYASVLTHAFTVLPKRGFPLTAVPAAVAGLTKRTLGHSSVGLP